MSLRPSVLVLALVRRAPLAAAPPPSRGSEALRGRRPRDPPARRSPSRPPPASDRCRRSSTYLVSRFSAAGFPEYDIHVMTYGETASLVVRYRGTPRAGAPKKKPIALLGHMDVVTAKPEDWQRDPFTLVEENGYFYGRGTYDDKNTVSLLTATFLRLKAEGFVPTRDLVLVFTGDEETGTARTRRTSSPTTATSSTPSTP